MVNKLLPNTFIAGCMRSGTTMMYEALKNHPQVLTSVLKEANYWDVRCEDDIPIDDYANLFPSDRFMTENHRVILDASPGYSYHNKAFARINDVLGPTPRILIMLREPTKRAISHFQWLRYYGFIEDKTIKRFRISNGDNGYVRDHWDKGGEKYTPSYHDIIARSIYYPQIFKARKYFDSVKVIFFEDFMSDTKKVLDEVADFLMIDRFDFTFPKYVEKKDIQKYTLPAADVDFLNVRFKESIEILQEDYNIEVPW
jgi:hypothetical protein